ncbi:unnamed protein product [Arctia plantaginis]|uniref:Major facilitator superfamily (MFS) profile domain-containing protein n=1 Tax=Arctia plantaginis TaxID=874455 RepID=A0A8S1A898_ARCPL|nr:unnamed protein product [Arctia plantaginis]
MDSDKVTFRAVAVQILATFSIAFLAALSGLLYSWPSYNVANFVSNETVLAEPMDSVQISLLGSVLNIGTFFLTPLVGWVMNKIGRKYTMICTGLPFVIGWSIIYINKSVVGVIVAMAIGGCGTAGQAAGTIFVSEIAHVSIRGALTSSILIIYFLGVLVSYAVGGYLSYFQIIYMQLTLAVLNIVMLSLLKDSPVYLLQKGREKEAAESLAFYRQTSPTSNQVKMELYNIKSQLDSTPAKAVDEGGDPTVTKELLDTPKRKNLSEWQFLKQSPSSTRAFIISLIVMAIMVLMGNMPLQVYAESLFREAVPSSDANKCSVWLAVDFVAATVMCSLIIDRLGRKVITIFTCAGASVCTVILGTLIQFQWAPEWFTMFMLYLYNFLFNMGIAVIPYVLIGEFFLPEVRSFCCSFTVSTGFGLNFVSTLIITLVMENYGFAPLFYGFSIVGFAGALFALFYLPETKGLSVEAIQMLFLKKNRQKIES